MLNRIFIIVVSLVILLIAAAFVVPRFVAWDNYRDRMQAIAADALGTDVRIEGDISFTLLPQPHLSFSDVVVGPADQPVFTVSGVEADFSLIDFLRDRYTVTQLRLERPVFVLTIDADGELTTAFQLADQVSTSNVSIADAAINNGTLDIIDQRSDRRIEASALNGQLQLRALRGPFAFVGSGFFEGQRYQGRIATSAMASDGTGQLSVSLRPEGGGRSIAVEGNLATGRMPRLEGTLTYRQQAPAEAQASAGQGDMVLTSPLTVSSEGLTLAGFTLLPDENRPATRLQGNVAVTFDAQPHFEASVTGGILSLPARDPTADVSTMPYELVQLLGELPMAPVAALPGTVRLEMAGLDLRGFSLRNIVADASTSATGWRLDGATAHLAGDSTLDLEGALANRDGRPQFSGTVTLSTERLDALSALWRQPDADTPLFDVPASLVGRVELTGDMLRLADGKLTLEDKEHVVSAELGFGATRSLAVRASFSDLSDADSRMLAALAPDASAPAFAATFPEGQFSFAARRASIDGLTGQGLAADGSWGASGITFGHLAADSLGGTAFDVSAQVSGTLAAPVISGRGRVAATASDAPAIRRLLDLAGASQPVREAVFRLLPGNLNLSLSAPAGDGSQTLAADGALGETSLSLTGRFDQGIAQAVTAPITIELTGVTDDAETLVSQFGLGDAQVFSPNAPVKVAIAATGTLADTLTGRIRAESNADHVAYEGTLVLSDPQGARGQGKIDLQLSDATALAEIAGAEGLSLPGLQGTADISFNGGQAVSLSNIDGASGGAGYSGALALSSEGGRRVVSGNLALAAVPIEELMGATGGRTALLRFDDGVWPNGPLDIGATPRQTTGRIAVTAPSLDGENGPILRDVRFDLAWDDQNIRLRNLVGAIGGGEVQLDIGVCCSNNAIEKRVSGRMTLQAVDLAAMLPQASAANVSGKLTGGVQFDGSGASIHDILAAMTGEGSFSLEDLSVEKLDPGVFQTVLGLDNIVDVSPDDLTNIVSIALDKGPFTAQTMTGGFTIAGGTIRVANVGAQGRSAKLFGGGSFKLDTLEVDGSFALTPTNLNDPAGLLDENTSVVAALVSGTLGAPERQLDLSTMVDAIQVRAYEAEVQRLEQLRAEDEARARAAAEERARLMEEQARRQAEEAARQAAEEEAARRAAEDAARQQQQRQTTPQGLDLNPPATQTPSGPVQLIPEDE